MRTRYHHLSLKELARLVEASTYPPEKELWEELVQRLDQLANQSGGQQR